MNKKVIFIILGVIVTILLLFVFLGKNKTPMTASQFITTMEQKGFLVNDATSQFSEYNYVKQVYVAAPSDYSYKIEFYELQDDSYATQFYNNNKSSFESSKGNASGETSVSMKNYSKYSLSTNGKFQVVSRIDNTVVYLNVNSDYKDNAKDLLKELGY